MGGARAYLGRWTEHLELRQWHNAATKGATVARILNVV